MNLQNIITEIENKVDPELQERASSRRSALRDFVGIGGKIALSSIPVALGSFFNKSYGQSSSATIIEILNYALTLEYLEAEFYATALTKSSITFPTDAAKNAIIKIKNDEEAHVNFLKNTIVSANGTVGVKPTFSFEENSTFGNVFADYVTFLAFAQAFEDTGVRAYKGRAKELVKGGAYLTAALNIHSVEARHASHIRQMRRASAGGNQTGMKPWITGANDSGIGASVNAVYAGEDNVAQGGVTITNLAGVSGNVSVNAATQSFDEPLTKDDVLVIAGLFIAS
jgi:hypothetical protein